MPELLDVRTPAIGYIRVSMAREEMISPELQQEAITKWAKRTNHRIIEWVQDLDKTGRNFKRKIMKAIERVEAGEARVIAVWKFSRFGRTRTGIEINLARIEQAGGQLISATEEVDPSTAAGWFQRDVIFSVAAFESKRAGEQWIDAQEWRRSQGLPATGGKRFGYIWQPRKVYAPDGSITLQEESYEPDPKLSETVEALYVGYCSGQGFSKLAASLNALGVLTTTEGQWNNVSLRVFMDSGFAAGYLRVHDKSCTVTPYSSTCPAHSHVKHPTKGHKAIISEDLWRQYLARRAFTSTAPPRTRAASYPLSGLVRCGLCGASARRATKADYAYLVCNTRSRQGVSVCEGFPNMTVAAADEQVLEWLERAARLVDPEVLDHHGQRRTVLEAKRQSAADRLASAEEDLRRVSRGIEKHMRIYAMSEADDPDGSLEREYLSTLAALRADKAAAEAVLVSASTVDPEMELEARRSAAVPVALGLVEEWDSAPPEELNALLRRIVGRVEIGQDGVVEVVPVWDLA